MSDTHATTVLAVRHRDRVVLAGDGQVTPGQAIVNERTDNIGARRLHAVMERLLDEVSFHASDMGTGAIVIDRVYVHRMLADTAKSDDLSRNIL